MFPKQRQHSTPPISFHSSHAQAGAHTRARTRSYAHAHADITPPRSWLHSFRWFSQRQTLSSRTCQLRRLPPRGPGASSARRVLLTCCCSASVRSTCAVRRWGWGCWLANFSRHLDSRWHRQVRGVRPWDGSPGSRAERVPLRTGPPCSWRTDADAGPGLLPSPELSTRGFAFKHEVSENSGIIFVVTNSRRIPLVYYVYILYILF